MRRGILYLFCLFFFNWALGGVYFRLAEPNTLLPLSTKEILLGQPVSIVVSSDANEPWQGGLFIRGQGRLLSRITGRGKEPVLRHYPASCLPAAGPNARAMLWKDSCLQGFDFYTEVLNAKPGDWFVVDYEPLRAGRCTIGFYDYTTGDPNCWSAPVQVLEVENTPSRDFREDGVVNLADFAHFASFWLTDGCSEPEWCAQTDLDTDGFVGLGDLVLFSEHWLWGTPGWQPPAPPSEPNVLYQVVDGSGAEEITLAVGDSVRLYIEKTTFEKDVCLLHLEAVISEPALGWIDNREYDPNEPQSSTAELLAEPRICFFDYWGPGLMAPEGIVFYAVNFGPPIHDGPAASFLYTAAGAGDVRIELLDYSQIPSRRRGILIHQTEPVPMTLKTTSSSKTAAVSASAAAATLEKSASATETSVLSEDAVEILDRIWEEDPQIRQVISEERWNQFIEQVKDENL